MPSRPLLLTRTSVPVTAMPLMPAMRVLVCLPRVAYPDDVDISGVAYDADIDVVAADADILAGRRHRRRRLAPTAVDAQAFSSPTYTVIGCCLAATTFEADRQARP
jgi:hypothetical protein